MDIIVGDYYLQSESLLKSKDIDYNFENSLFRLYEVIRTIDGVLLFLEDHLERLKQGANSINVGHLLEGSNLKYQLRELLNVNDYRKGNIKVLFSTINEPEKIAAYFIPHTYPEPAFYIRGVDLVTLKCERSNPLIKQVEISNSIRRKIEEAKLDNDVYEVLLLNNQNCITEGSKSNFFLVKDTAIYSAPADSILSGITRKYVLNIAKEMGIEIIHQNINIEDLNKFDAAFICGTSPKIMPVRKINSIKLDSNNSTIEIIKTKYDSIIEEYIKKNK